MTPSRRRCPRHASSSRRASPSASPLSRSPAAVRHADARRRAAAPTRAVAGRRLLAPRLRRDPARFRRAGTGARQRKHGIRGAAPRSRPVRRPRRADPARRRDRTGELRRFRVVRPRRPAARCPAARRFRLRNLRALPSDLRRARRDRRRCHLRGALVERTRPSGMAGARDPRGHQCAVGARRCSLRGRGRRRRRSAADPRRRAHSASRTAVPLVRCRRRLAPGCDRRRTLRALPSGTARSEHRRARTRGDGRCGNRARRAHRKSYPRPRLPLAIDDPAISDRHRPPYEGALRSAGHSRPRSHERTAGRHRRAARFRGPRVARRMARTAGRNAPTPDGHAGEPAPELPRLSRDRALRGSCPVAGTCRCVGVAARAPPLPGLSPARRATRLRGLQVAPLLA